MKSVNAQSLNHVQLFDPMDSSPPGSSVHGIFQARILQWVAISFSGGSQTLSFQHAIHIKIINEIFYILFFPSIQSLQNLVCNLPY